MIRTPKELQFYIMADCMMNRGYFKVPLKTRIVNLLCPDDIMSFLSLMRKCSYYGRRGGGIFFARRWLLQNQIFKSL